MPCSICLEPFTEPVVTPCGHVFCLQCLIASCQKSPDATKAPCPACRTTFSLVSPNQMFIPEKYRQFIDSNVRKLYIDDSPEKELQERVVQLEARVMSLEMQKDQLMERCELYMQSNQMFALREHRMRERYVQLQDQIAQAKTIVKESNRVPHIKQEEYIKKEEPASPRLHSMEIETDTDPTHAVKNLKRHRTIDTSTLPRAGPSRPVVTSKRLRVRRVLEKID
ncbi:hypothetical protein M422DRAFT_63599 [Sphaerobolus stellatus SS14]|nr:hypothetical protein M422DRAFT_63599 [Sphaerobolus stellatus SS14]